LQGTTTVDVFKKHPNPVFIETGSYIGDGINMALMAGFSEVYSIELSPQLYNKCIIRFSGRNNVHIYQGDSTIVLKKLLPKINQRVTFWLDGHYSGPGTALGKTNSPILQELAIIASHPIKNHTILIDDVRLFGTVEFDFVDINEIVDAIRKINPNYIFYFENGYVPNDVLVAKILE